jgi:Glycosyl hydrolase family 26
MPWETTMTARRATRVAAAITFLVVFGLIAACGSSAGQPTATAGSPGGHSVPRTVEMPPPSASPSTRPSNASPSPSMSKPPRSTTVSRPRDALSGVGSTNRDAWATWRRLPVQIEQVWNDPSGSDGKVTWALMDGLASTKHGSDNGTWSGAMSIAQPMFADNETLQQCASSSEITTWARDLKKALPSGSAYIRLGWEFNGDWFHWSVTRGDVAAFKSCWIKWYTLVKQVSTKFELVWNPNNQSSDATVDVRDFWPGSAYVDAAGPDAYALSVNGKLMSPDRKGPNGEPLGIDSWVNWVASKGVPFAVPEWAVHDGVVWGSVDPAYVDQMRAAFVKAARSATGLAYESYFDGGSTHSCIHSIHDPNCPGAHTAAANRYLALWSKPYVNSHR